MSPLGFGSNMSEKAKTGSAVSAATLAAMGEALDDEYKARATYRKVIATFGPVRPFVNIVEAEDRHVRALLDLYAGFGVAPPIDDWPGRVTAPASLEEACTAAVQGEIDNAAMYDRLLAAVDDPAVQNVLRALQRASQENHLPAFRRCLARDGGDGGGGRGRRFRGGRGRGA
jgi:rubrerythrin